MSDTNKWMASARVSLDELDKLCKWQRNQRVQLLVQVDDLEKEIKRLREVAHRKDMQIGARDKELNQLRERHVAFMQWMIENYDEIVNEWEASE